jgi:hypothetical protein
VLEQAIAGVYSPCGNWSTRGYNIAFLTKAIGGPQLLYALQKFRNLPSLSSVRHNRKIPSLLPSVTTPSQKEMSINITSFLGPDGKSASALHNGEHPGQVLILDGAALEELGQWEASRNVILGLCREHSSNINLTVTSVEVVDAIEEALKDGSCCLGKDGTVVAIAPIADSEYYYPVPLILSPSCKQEKRADLAKWLNTLLTVYKSHTFGEKIHGPIRTIASDGEASFQTARFFLCMKTRLDSQSDLGKILCKIPGLNCYTGDHGILGTCDPKHVIKRFATLIRSPLGVFIYDTMIIPYNIVENLASLDLGTETVDQLLNPTDKQNVPKAVKLVQALGRLQEDDNSLSPAEGLRCSRIKFLSEVFSYFLLPFVDVRMSLSEQVRSLSTYVHITSAMYLKNGLGFLTGALYADSHAIVKNIVFTTGHLQRICGSIKYYIIFEGSDRIE